VCAGKVRFWSSEVFMRVFLAGAGGAIGRRLTPLLVKSGHQVTGTTRSADKAGAIGAMGAEPVVVDVFDAAALTRAVAAAKPDAVIHQLTDLAFAPGTPQYEEALARNARIRIEGTPNLAAAARAAGVRRFIAQSIAFIYPPGPGARVETDPMAPAEGAMARTIPAVKALEAAALAMPEGIVLRYGYFYGPGTWSADGPARRPGLHIDAAAQAAANALTRGEPGIYNIAEDDPTLSSEKAKRLLGFDPDFRLSV
jgi:nucleoside-diphosphate-sugar epimerase